jgi:integrase/recombinase XerD
MLIGTPAPDDRPGGQRQPSDPAPHASEASGKASAASFSAKRSETCTREASRAPKNTNLDETITRPSLSRSPNKIYIKIFLRCERDRDGQTKTEKSPKETRLHKLEKKRNGGDGKKHSGSFAFWEVYCTNMQYKWTDTGDQATDDLGRQFAKIMRGANRGAIKTRYRYAEAGARFVKWVQPVYKIKKLANLQDKHLIAYAEHLKNSGCTEKYIKNELSALRYIHSITPNTRFGLSDSKKINQAAGLGSTRNHRAASINRAWTDEELEKFCACALRHNRPDIEKMARLTRALGLRLEEAATLRRHELENALRRGEIHLTNTKGGRERFVSLRGDSRAQCEEIIRDVSRGERVFIPENIKTHEYIKSVKDFVLRHREEIQDQERIYDERRSELSWHGLRHAYAQERYQELREQGKDDREARIEIAHELGHGRIEITYVYVP